METFLVLNGFEISASTDEQEQIILNLASGELRREAFTDWLQQNKRKRKLTNHCTRLKAMDWLGYKS